MRGRFVRPGESPHDARTIGVWLVFTALRRGMFFEVETVQGTKRLAFQKRPEAAALDAFLKSIEERYGTRVEKR